MNARSHTVTSMSLWLLGIIATLFLYQSSSAQIPPHLEKRGNAIQLIVKGEPFLMLGGELHNSSASSLEYMDSIWDKLVDLHLNTVLATVTWEQFEPVEGQYDYTLIDGLIRDARKHDLKLVILWFASWKNGQSSYPPAWVKANLERFPRVQNKNGRIGGVITPLCRTACESDAKAFAAMMGHIREIDAWEQTVLAVQVENEVGLLGDSRDRSPMAEQVFSSPVPQPLMKYLVDHKDTLIPELKQVWEANGMKESGTWGEIFGNNLEGDEVFMAWHYAQYIGKVIAAGKAEYPIPMYVNAWLVQSEGQEPGKYPSGGPVSKMMDVWRAAAPLIDVIAPDIYLPTFTEVCQSYTRSGNPLFIPEVSPGDEAAGRAFYVFGKHNAICFAPFGIESVSIDHPLAKAYALLSSILPQIAQAQAEGNMIGVLESDKPERMDVELGNCNLEINFIQRGNIGEKREKGYGLIIALEPDEFLIAGSGISIHPGAKKGIFRQTEILSVQEGYYKEGEWCVLRQLNSDETAANWKAQIPPNVMDRHHPGVFGEPLLLRMKVLFFD